MTHDQMPISTQDLELVAFSPAELREAQDALTAWCAGRLAEVGAELAEAQERLAKLGRSTFRLAGFERAITGTRRKQAYYEKLSAAVSAGYLIIPNFPINAFAVRTTRRKPDPGPGASWSSQVPNTTAMVLPAGEGRYVNPEPLVRNLKREELDPQTKQTKTINQWVASAFQDGIDFPVIAVKARVLEAAQRALALKIFDEVGLVGAAPKKDPIIVGRIYRRQDRWSPEFVTFFIAWWLNTRAL